MLYLYGFGIFVNLGEYAVGDFFTVLAQINKYGVSISDLENASKSEYGFTQFGESQEELFELYDKYSLLILVY